MFEWSLYWRAIATALRNGRCFLLHEARCCGPTKAEAEAEAEVSMREAPPVAWHGSPRREAGDWGFGFASGDLTGAALLGSDSGQIFLPDCDLGQIDAGIKYRTELSDARPRCP
jgi:hypothetical protein